MLGKILATPVNLLVLDEPTNHLDMQSCDALIAALDNFDGAVIMVTHNELFLHALAERLVIFQNGRIDIFEGRYQEFLDRIGWQEEGRTGAANSTEAVAPEQKFSKKEMRKLRSDIISERSRVLAPLEKKIAAAEAAIEAFEAELASASAAMQSASESGEALRMLNSPKSSAVVTPTLTVCLMSFPMTRRKLTTLKNSLTSVSPGLKLQIPYSNERCRFPPRLVNLAALPSLFWKAVLRRGRDEREGSKKKISLCLFFWVDRGFF